MEDDPIGYGEGIDLDLGPDSVEPSEFELVPDGVYKVFASKVEVSNTKAGELMLTLQLTIDEVLSFSDPDDKWVGRMVFDRWVVPGSARKAGTLTVPNKTPEQITKSWHQMMNMLRDRLEAVYQTEWREDSMKLKPSDLSGRMVKIMVVQEPYKDNKTGVTKMSNSVKQYIAMDTETPPIQSNSSASAGAGSSFKL